jgi:MGT family glycosyltransferase
MNRQLERSKTIAFFPEASFGAALNCVAIAQALARYGANPVFICHPGFRGVFADYGFKEYHLPAPPQGDGRSVADYWQAFINRHLPHFDLSPLAQLPTYVGPTWEAIVDTAIAAEEGLSETLSLIRPDVIVLDNVIMFPAVMQAGCPWVRVISCAETELPDPWVPPYLSGLAAEDAVQGDAFRRAYLAATGPAHARYAGFRRAQGLPELPVGQFLETSPALNLLLSPAPVRYARKAPLDPDSTVYLEGCVREEARFEVPVLPDNRGPLVYFSFGSLGSIDTRLIDRMIRVFATIEARFIVNVGGGFDAYRQVPDNVSLGSWFPQPSVVQQCDLFIHHGGNNSFCEALFFGVPSLVMPYCWDGHDNAMRAAQTGTGRWMHRSDWTDAAFREAILGLLSDQEMRRRLKDHARQMQAQPGNEAAARAILGLFDAGSADRGRQSRALPDPVGQHHAG